MAENLYTVYFRGEISEGHTPDEVQQQLASVLRIDEGRIGEAFKGRALVTKDLTREKVLKLVTALEKVGALCQIEVQRLADGPTPPSRPPQRSASQPQQTKFEQPTSIQAPRTPEPDQTSELEDVITCAKCGLMQPRGTECVRCGVLFDKIETVTQLANDPIMIAREIAESYRPRLRSETVSLTPAIPHQTVAKVLKPYLDPQAHWEDDEEFVINADEELIAMIATSEALEKLRSNLLLTNLKMLVFRWADGPVCAGFDLWSMKRIDLVGEKGNMLLVDEKILELPIISLEDREIRKTFIKMVSEIVRALKQADSAARLQAKRAWQADSRHGRPEPGGFPGATPHKGRITLESLDLLPSPPSVEAGKDDSSEGRDLLSGIKGLFKKK